MMEYDDFVDTGKIGEDFSSLGHSFGFAFTVRDLVNVQPYIFKQDIETKCDILPTSWSLEFMFEQAPDTDVASCTITARRNDDDNKTLTTHIEMVYRYLEYPDHQMERLYTREFQPGQEIREKCSDVLPFPEESAKYLEKGLGVEVTLYVKCCDREGK